MSLLRKSGEQRPESLAPPKLSAGQSSRANATSSITLHSGTTVSSLSGVSTSSDIGGNSSAMVSEAEIISMLRDTSVLPINENDEASGSSRDGFSLLASPSSEDTSFSVARALGKSRGPKKDEFAVKMVSTSGDSTGVMSLDKGVRVASPTAVPENRVEIQSGRKTVSPSSPQSKAEVMKLSRLLVQEARTQGSPTSKESGAQSRQSPPLVSDTKNSSKPKIQTKKIATAVSKDLGDQTKSSQPTKSVSFEQRNMQPSPKGGADKQMQRVQKQQGAPHKVVSPVAASKKTNDRYRSAESPLRDAMRVAEREQKVPTRTEETKQKQRVQDHKSASKIASPDATPTKMRGDRYKSTESPLRDAVTAAGRATGGPRRQEKHRRQGVTSKIAVSPSDVLSKAKEDRYAVGSGTTSPLRGARATVDSLPSSPSSPEKKAVSSYNKMGNKKEEAQKTGSASKVAIFQLASPTKDWDDRYAVDAEPNSPLHDVASTGSNYKLQDFDRVMSLAINRLGNGLGNQAPLRSKPPVSPKTQKQQVQRTKVSLRVDQEQVPDQESPTTTKDYHSPNDPASPDVKSKSSTPETCLNLSSGPSDGSVDSGNIALMALSTEEIESIIKNENAKSLHYIPGIMLKPRWSNDAATRGSKESRDLSLPEDKYSESKKPFEPHNDDEQSETSSVGRSEYRKRKEKLSKPVAPVTSSALEELDGVTELNGTQEKEGLSTSSLFSVMTFASQFLANKKDENASEVVQMNSEEQKQISAELESVMAVAGRASEDKSSSTDLFRSGISAHEMHSEPDKWCRAPPPEAFDFDCLPRDRYEAMCGDNDTQPYLEFTTKSIVSDRTAPPASDKAVVVSASMAQSVNTSGFSNPFGKDGSCCGLLNVLERDETNPKPLQSPTKSPTSGSKNEPVDDKTEQMSHEAVGVSPTNQSTVQVSNSKATEKEASAINVSSDQNATSKTDVVVGSEKETSPAGHDSAVKHESNDVKCDTPASGLSLLDKDDPFWDGLSTIASTLDKSSSCRNVGSSKADEANATTHDSEPVRADKSEHADGRKCLCCNWKQQQQHEDNSKSKALSGQTKQSDLEKEKDGESNGGDGRSSPSHDIPHVISLTFPENFSLSRPIQDEANKERELEAVSDAMKKLEELLSDDSSDQSSLSYSRDSEGNGEKEKRQHEKQDISDPTFSVQESPTKSRVVPLKKRPAMYGEDAGEAPLPASPSIEERQMVNATSTDETSDGDNTENRDESGSQGHLERYLERTMPLEEKTSSEDVMAGTSSQDATGSTRVSSAETNESLKGTPTEQLGNTFSADSDDVGALLLSVTRSDSDFVPPNKNGSFSDDANNGDLDKSGLDASPDKTNASKPFDRRQPSLDSISEQGLVDSQDGTDKSTKPKKNQDSTATEGIKIDDSTKVNAVVFDSTNGKEARLADKIDVPQGEMIENSTKTQNREDSKTSDMFDTESCKKLKSVAEVSHNDKKTHPGDKTDVPPAKLTEGGQSGTSSSPRTGKAQDVVDQKESFSLVEEEKKGERLATTDSETESTLTPAMDEVLSKYDAIVQKLLKKNLELKDAAKGKDRSPSFDSIELEKILSDIRAQSGKSNVSDATGILRNKGNVTDHDSELKDATKNKAISQSVDSVETEQKLSGIAAQTEKTSVSGATEKMISGIRGQSGKSNVSDATGIQRNADGVSELKDTTKNKNISQSIDSIETEQKPGGSTTAQTERTSVSDATARDSSATRARGPPRPEDVSFTRGRRPTRNREAAPLRHRQPSPDGYREGSTPNSRKSTAKNFDASLTSERHIAHTMERVSLSRVQQLSPTSSLRSSASQTHQHSPTASHTVDPEVTHEASSPVMSRESSMPNSRESTARNLEAFLTPERHIAHTTERQSPSRVQQLSPTSSLRSLPSQTRQHSPKANRTVDPEPIHEASSPVMSRKSSMPNSRESTARNLDASLTSERHIARTMERELPSRVQQLSPTSSLRSSPSQTRQHSPLASRHTVDPEAIHEASSPVMSRESSMPNGRESAARNLDASRSSERHIARTMERELPLRVQQLSPTSSLRSSPSQTRQHSPTASHTVDYEAIHEASSPVRSRHTSPTKMRYGSPTRELRDSQFISRYGSPTREFRDSPLRIRYGSPTRELRDSPTRRRYGSPELRDSPLRSRYGSPVRETQYSSLRSRYGSPTMEQHRVSPTRNRYDSPTKSRQFSPRREYAHSPTRNRQASPRKDRHSQFSPGSRRHSPAKNRYGSPPGAYRRELSKGPDDYFSDESDPELVYMERRKASPIRRRCYSLSPVRRRHDQQFSAHMKKARELRMQLDTARFTSQSIRRCHASLSLELNTFKHKLHRHAKSKQGERALLVASQNVLKEYQDRLHQKKMPASTARNQKQETISGREDDFEDVRHLMLRNLKLLNEAQYALVEEKMKMKETKEREKKRRTRQGNDPDEDRLKDIEKTLDDLRSNDNITNEIVMKCLDNARNLLRTSKPTLHRATSM